MASEFVSAREALNYNTQMANTAHQREIADLKAAGLNPVLSAKFGGAAVPTVPSSAILDSGSIGSVGSGSGSGITSGREGFLGGLIDSLDPNKSTKIFGIQVPNSVIAYLYDHGAAAVDQLADKVSEIVGANVSGINLLNILNGSAEDSVLSNGHGQFVDKSGLQYEQSFEQNMDAASLGLDADTAGRYFGTGSAYRNAQNKQSNTKVERFLGAINPRLLDMYWHVTGQDEKRKRAERGSN